MTTSKAGPPPHDEAPVEGFENVKEKPVWLLPAILGGMTLVAGLFVTYSYLGPSLDELFGNRLKGTEHASIIRVRIGDVPLFIPANYTQYSGDRSDGPRPGILLYGMLPNLEPFSEENAHIFYESSPNSPIVHIKIEDYYNPLSESERFEKLYSMLVDNKESERVPHKLSWHRFRLGTAYENQDLFLFETDEGEEGILLCVKATASSITKPCQRETRLPNGLALRYSFARAHLSQWQDIDRKVRKLVMSFQSEPKSQ